MIDGYVAHMQRKNRSPGTVRLRLFYLDKFAGWLTIPLEAAEHDDMLAYLRSNREWSDATRQSASASLKSFYAWATREGHFALNPARDLPTVLVRRRPQRIASEEAIRHAIEVEDLSIRTMVILGAECGLRVSEIARLHQSNRDGDWLNVVGKGGQERTLNASPELGALLTSLEDTQMRHGWYFPGRSGIQPMHVSTAWRHIRGVLASNPHSLRRRAGTIVYRGSGNDIRLAQTFLGHAQSTTTERYLEVAKDDLSRAATLTRIAA